jgi:hypothetical protein
VAVGEQRNLHEFKRHELEQAQQSTSQHLNRVASVPDASPPWATPGCPCSHQRRGELVSRNQRRDNALQYAASAASGSGVDRLLGNHECGSRTAERGRTKSQDQWSAGLDLLCRHCTAGLLLIAGQSGLQVVTRPMRRLTSG